MTGIFDPEIFDPGIFDTGEGGTGGGAGGLSIVWRYEGDDITADVELKTARAVSRTNGSVGEAMVRVRDRSREFVASATAYAPGYFHAGGTLELYIAGERVWDGWVMRVGRTWAFDVDNTDRPATPRWWVLRGVDRNIVLQRRHIYNQADPADASGIPDFPLGTMDDVALGQMLDDFTDLDLARSIQAVATVSEVEAYVLGQIGAPVGLIFEDCSKVTGGVYYVSPGRVLTYTDDVTVNAPFSLSDTPHEEVGSVGYREVEDELLSDDMANDALVWGAGRGSASPVFGRYESQASIDTYGRWQWADIWTGAIKTLTVERRAESYVEGSLSHQRGHGEPQPQFRCVVFEPGLIAGMVVTISHNVYGTSFDLPLREVVMTFPTPTSCRYELTLSLTYDSPFGIVDEWWGDEEIPIGDPGWLPPAGECGVIIDEFDRAYNTGIDDGWGTATGGASWLPDDHGNGAKEVQDDNGQGEVLGGTDSPVHGYNRLNHAFTSLPTSLLFRWRYTRTDFSSLTGYTIGFMTTDPSSGVPLYTHSLDETDEDPSDDGGRYHLTRMVIGTSEWQAKTWLEEAGEPSGWQKSGSHDISAHDLDVFLNWIHDEGDEGNRFYVDFIREVSGGFDELCGFSSGVIDSFGREVRRDATNQLFPYATWSEWFEWRVIGAGPTYAHGEGIVHEAPVGPGSQFKETWYSDSVIDDVDGNPAPTNPPPTIIYVALARFRNWEYVRNRSTGVDFGGHWGTADAGGTWTSIANRHIMQGIYGGSAIAFPGDSDDGGYAYLSGLTFGTGMDILLRWRCLGTSESEPKLLVCGHLVATPTSSVAPDYEMDSSWRYTRVKLDGTRFRARTWYEAGSEPGDWDLDETHALHALVSGWTGASTTHLSLAVIMAQPGGDAGNPAYPYSEFQFAQIDHYGGGSYNGVVGTGTADSQNEAGGWSGNSNRYQTDYPYQAGTLRVFLRGMELRPGIDFTETNPSTGVFTLNTAFIENATYDQGDSLQVRYKHASSIPNVPIVNDNGTSDPGQTGGRVYRPRIQRQYGWGTPWDGENCNMASGAMLLDRHTLGQFSDVRGTPRSNPPNMRYFSGDYGFGDGTTQGELQDAWENGWNRSTLFLGQIQFQTFVNMVNAGRGAVIAGIYGALPDRLRFSATFRGAHAVFCNEQFDNGSFLIYDPLTSKSLVYTRAEIRRYMTTFTGSADTDNGLVLCSFSRETQIS